VRRRESIVVFHGDLKKKKVTAPAATEKKISLSRVNNCISGALVSGESKAHKKRTRTIENRSQTHINYFHAGQ